MTTRMVSGVGHVTEILLENDDDTLTPAAVIPAVSNFGKPFA